MAQQYLQPIQSGQLCPLKTASSQICVQQQQMAGLFGMLSKKVIELQINVSQVKKTDKLAGAKKSTMFPRVVHYFSEHFLCSVFRASN